MDGQGVTGFVSFESLVAIEGDDSRRQVVLIKPGMSKNRLRWDANVLRQASESHLFDGARMFRDHNRTNPLERKTTELVAGIQSTVMGQEDRLIGDVKFYDKAFLSFAEEAQLGTSIVVGYVGEKGRDQDGPFVRPTKITKVISTDWVPFPANEGTGIYAQESFVMDYSSMTPEEFDALKKARPELFAHEGQASGPAFDQEAFKTEIAASIKGVVQEAVREVQDSMAQEATARKNTADSIENYLRGVAVPASTKARIRSQFDGATEYNESQLKLAVESAQAEIKEILKSAGVTGPVVVGAGVTGSAQEGSSTPSITDGSEQSMSAVNSAFFKKTPKSAGKGE